MHMVDDPRYEGFSTNQRSLFGNRSFAEDFHFYQKTISRSMVSPEQDVGEELK